MTGMLEAKMTIVTGGRSVGQGNALFLAVECVAEVVNTRALGRCQNLGGGSYQGIIAISIAG